MEEEFDILEILKMFWNKRIQIILIILFFMIIGYIYTVYFIQPQYRSESTIILANNNESENYNEKQLKKKDRLTIIRYAEKFGYIDDLYTCCVKLYESEVKEILKELYELHKDR